MYQSIYETEFAVRPSYDALPESRNVDVAIIGGGLTGISAALTLAEAGFTPVVLEAGQIGADIPERPPPMMATSTVRLSGSAS